MSYNLSALFERVTDTVPDRVALASPARQLTYRQLDDRATQLAHWLRKQGVGEGTRVGLYLLNGSEYIEGMLACFKLRAVPININHRYVPRELAYLLDDASINAMIVHRRFVPTLDEAVTSAEGGALDSTLVVGDDTGEGDYESVLAAQSTARDFEGRSSDDLYLCYTGGTTGFPKGVMWRHEDLFFGALGGGDPLLDKGHITSPDEIGSRVPEWPITQLCTPPFMHVSAHWGAFNTFFGGGKVVVLAPGAYSGDEVWEAVERESVNTVVVVGDAMARPALDALEAREDRSCLNTMLVFASGGAVLSGTTKERIKELMPNVILVDTFGSSETGVVGTRSGDHGAGVRFTVDERTAVLDEHGHPVEPGSGVIGRLARHGHLPLGYLNDEAKTASTFVTYNGKRWVLPGDLASVEADGSVSLHGRGSNCINTGGEKVFPEEVEQVLKGAPGVEDALVVGLPDDKWGSRVVAVITPTADGFDADAAQTFARGELSAYKVPKQWLVTDQTFRGTNAKPNYVAAREWALEQVDA